MIKMYIEKKRKATSKLSLYLRYCKRAQMSKQLIINEIKKRLAEMTPAEQLIAKQKMLEAIKEDRRTINNEFSRSNDNILSSGLN